MSQDVIIVDQNFADAAEKIKDYGSHISSIAHSYIEIMEYIVSEAVQDQKISVQLSRIIEQIRQIPDSVEICTGKVQQLLEQFVRDIDAADQFLY